MIFYAFQVPNHAFRACAVASSYYNNFITSSSSFNFIVVDTINIKIVKMENKIILLALSLLLSLIAQGVADDEHGRDHRGSFNKE